MRTDDTIVRAALVVVATAAALGILYVGRSLWIPLSVAGLIAMLVAPIHHFLTRHGWPRWLGIALSMSLVLLVFAGMVGAVGRQAAQFAKQWPKIERNVNEQLGKLEESYPRLVPDQLLGLTDTSSGGEATGAASSPVEASSPSGQSSKESSKDSKAIERAASELGSGGGGGIWGSIAKALSMTVSALGALLLIFVFTILLLTQEARLKAFVLRTAVRDDREAEGREVLSEIAQVAQNYLRGQMILVSVLFVIYSIGFSISGLEYAVFAAFLAALMAIIPYIGNIIGGALALAVALVSGGSAPMIGVLITMSLGQLLENYVLTPIVVGEEVSLNPLSTLVAVVAFGLLWGPIGAVVAIPLVGMLRVVFDAVPAYRNLGLLLGDRPVDQSNTP